MRRILRADTVLLPEAAILLAEAAVLLTERTLILLLAVHLTGGSAYLRSTNCRRLIGPFQQDVLLVHHRVINELPFVVSLLLVVNANGWILAHAGNSDDRTPAKRLPIVGARGGRAARLITIRPTGLVCSRVARLVAVRAEIETLTAARSIASKIIA